MLKRFYLLSFTLAFLSIGTFAATLEIHEDFQFGTSCANPPQITHDDNVQNYWQYSFTSTMVNTGSGNIYSHAVYRYITIDFYRSVPSGDIYEASLELPYSRVFYANNTFSFDVNDLPNLPSGDYVMSFNVRYENRSGVPDGNIELTVKRDGNTVCGVQTLTNDANNNGSGDASCYIPNIACFGYQSCHSISISSGKFSDWVNVIINGGTGSYQITWYVEEWKANPLPGPGSGTYYYNVTSVPKECGKYVYFVTVVDLNTGCSMDDSRIFTNGCYGDLPSDDLPGQIAMGGRFGQETSPSFSIFPNPTSNETVQIQYELPQEAASAQLSLYNIQGQLVQSIELNLMSNEQKIRLENLTKGVYVANLKVDGRRLSSQKLVVQ